MTLTTTGPTGLWSCSVYYVVDDDFNLFFVSESTTTHIQNTRRNSQVAVNIADSSQKVTAKKIGLQIQGKVNEESNRSKLKTIVSMWNRVNPGLADVVNLKNIIHKVINSKVYRIRPTLIKLFNEALYGSEGFKVFKF